MSQSILTLKEVADYLRVHPSTIYRLIKKRKIPAFQIGADWRFNVEAIDQWRLNGGTGTQDAATEQPVLQVKH